MTPSAGTVLVVEDNPITRKLLRVTLATEGFTVFEAEDGRTALALAEATQPDVVLQDLILPDSHGLDLLPKMRALPGMAAVPIVACTGFMPQDEEARAAAAGFSAFLLKPVEPSRVVETVRAFTYRPKAVTDAEHGRRVLVVDDDEIQRKLTRLQLENAGYEVLTAADGETGLAIARAKRPDAILSDVLMPRLDGFRFCLAVRKDPHIGDTPVILQTNKFTEYADHELARRVGANAYLTRGFESTEAVEVVKAAIADPRTPSFRDLDDQGYSQYLDRIVHQLERQTTLNSGLIQRYSELASAFSILGATSDALAERRENEISFAEILHRCIDAAGISVGVVYLMQDGGDLTVHSAAGVEGGDPAARSLTGAALLRRVFADGVPRTLSSGDGDVSGARELLRGVGAACALISRITFHDEALGVILLGSSSARTVGDEWFKCASVVSGQLAQSIVLSRVFEQLRERDERLTQLADNISEVFFLISADLSEVYYINRAYEEIWGRSRESLNRDSATLITGVIPEDREVFSDAISEARRGHEPAAVELRVMRPDGAVRLVLAHMAPVRDARGSVYRLSGVILDITERRDAQRALQESVERFRSLTDASFDSVDISQDGCVREVNRGFLDTFGYDSVAEVIGRPVEEFCAEESREIVAHRMRKGIEGTYTMVGRKRDGTRLQLEITSRATMHNGRAARISAIRDHTQQRALEAQFRQAQKMEAVGRLAGGVAHDFNNLLTVISSYADFVVNDIESGVPRREDVEEIRRAATAAAALTRQLLAFSRQQVIQPRPIVVDEALASMDKILRRVIGEDIELTTVPAPHPLVVTVDPGQFEQVIMNLAVNARDAMPTGGMLKISTSDLTVDNATAREAGAACGGRFVSIAVTDTGVGMDEQTKARIFEPFFTTKDVGKGTGLGLATVYGIVSQANGFISVMSEPSRGATFTVFLPATEGAEPDEQTVDADLPRGAETVLLVEDAAAVRTAVLRMLQRLGYVVIEAPDGKAALRQALVSGARIDLLLTDVVMPGMSGRELAEQIVAAQPAAKVLYMSGYTDDAVLRHGVSESGVGFLQKPFRPEVLARKLREILDGSRSVQ